MKDEDKTKPELISELQTLRKKYTELKEFISSDHAFKALCGKETILVVDDHPDTRTTTVEILKEYGYDVLEADSPAKAVEVFQSHDGIIHLILSDVVMPEMNGPEMVAKLLSLKPETKVVFMSGYAEKDIIHDEVFDIVQSHNAFIEKPFTFQELGRILRQQLYNTNFIKG